MMEQNANDNLPPQALCRMGCGFYGSQSWDGLCSKCYKDAFKRKQNSTPLSGRSSPLSASPSGAHSTSIGQGEVEPSAIDSVSTALAHSSIGQDGTGGGLASSTTNVACSNTHGETSNRLNVTSSSQSLLPGDTTPSIHTATPTVPVVSSEKSSDAGSTTEMEGGASGLGTPSPGADSQDDQQADRKPKKNRCHTCKKKVGLTGFQCRCGGLYCSLHRYSDKHDCSFDYREHAQEQIRRNNPVVRGDKLQKI